MDGVFTGVHRSLNRVVGSILEGYGYIIFSDLLIVVVRGNGVHNIISRYCDAIIGAGQVFNLNRHAALDYQGAFCACNIAGNGHILTGCRILDGDRGRPDICHLIVGIQIAESECIVFTNFNGIAAVDGDGGNAFILHLQQILIQIGQHPIHEVQLVIDGMDCTLGQARIYGCFIRLIYHVKDILGKLTLVECTDASNLIHDQLQSGRAKILQHARHCTGKAKDHAELAFRIRLGGIRRIADVFRDIDSAVIQQSLQFSQFICRGQYCDRAGHGIRITRQRLSYKFYQGIHITSEFNHSINEVDEGFLCMGRNHHVHGGFVHLHTGDCEFLSAGCICIQLGYYICDRCMFFAGIDAFHSVADKVAFGIIFLLAVKLYLYLIGSPDIQHACAEAHAIHFIADHIAVRILDLFAIGVQCNAQIYACIGGNLCAVAYIAVQRDAHIEHGQVIQRIAEISGYTLGFIIDRHLYIQVNLIVVHAIGAACICNFQLHQFGHDHDGVEANAGQCGCSRIGCNGFCDGNRQHAHQTTQSFRQHAHHCIHQIAAGVSLQCFQIDAGQIVRIGYGCGDDICAGVLGRIIRFGGDDQILVQQIQNCMQCIKCAGHEAIQLAHHCFHSAGTDFFNGVHDFADGATLGILHSIIDIFNAQQCILQGLNVHIAVHFQIQAIGLQHFAHPNGQVHIDHVHIVDVAHQLGHQIAGIGHFAAAQDAQQNTLDQADGFVHVALCHVQGTGVQCNTCGDYGGIHFAVHGLAAHGSSGYQIVAGIYRGSCFALFIDAFHHAVDHAGQTSHAELQVALKCIHDALYFNVGFQRLDHHDVCADGNLFNHMVSIQQHMHCNGCIHAGLNGSFFLHHQLAMGVHTNIDQLCDISLGCGIHNCSMGQAIIGHGFGSLNSQIHCHFRQEHNCIIIQNGHIVGIGHDAGHHIQALVVQGCALAVEVHGQTFIELIQCILHQVYHFYQGLNLGIELVVQLFCLYIDCIYAVNALGQVQDLLDFFLLLQFGLELIEGLQDCYGIIQCLFDGFDLHSGIAADHQLQQIIQPIGRGYVHAVHILQQRQQIFDLKISGDLGYQIGCPGLQIHILAIDHIADQLLDLCADIFIVDQLVDCGVDVARLLLTVFIRAAQCILQVLHAQGYACADHGLADLFGFGIGCGGNHIDVLQIDSLFRIIDAALDVLQDTVHLDFGGGGLDGHHALVHAECGHGFAVCLFIHGNFHVDTCVLGCSAGSIQLAVAGNAHIEHLQVCSIILFAANGHGQDLFFCIVSEAVDGFINLHAYDFGCNHCHANIHGGHIIGIGHSAGNQIDAGLFQLEVSGGGHLQHGIELIQQVHQHIHGCDGVFFRLLQDGLQGIQAGSVHFHHAAQAVHNFLNQIVQIVANLGLCGLISLAQGLHGVLQGQNGHITVEAHLCQCILQPCGHIDVHAAHMLQQAGEIRDLAGFQIGHARFDLLESICHGAGLQGYASGDDGLGDGAVHFALFILHRYQRIGFHTIVEIVGGNIDGSRCGLDDHAAHVHADCLDIACIIGFIIVGKQHVSAGLIRCGFAIETGFRSGFQADVHQLQVFGIDRLIAFNGALCSDFHRLRLTIVGAHILVHFQTAQLFNGGLHEVDIHDFGCDHQCAIIHRRDMLGVGHDAHYDVSAAVLDGAVIAQLQRDIAGQGIQGIDHLVDHCLHIQGGADHASQQAAIFIVQLLQDSDEAIGADLSVIGGQILLDHVIQPCGHIQMCFVGVLQGELLVQGHICGDHGGVGNHILHLGGGLHHLAHSIAAEVIRQRNQLILHIHAAGGGQDGHSAHCHTGSGDLVVFILLGVHSHCGVSAGMAGSSGGAVGAQVGLQAGVGYLQFASGAFRQHNLHAMGLTIHGRHHVLLGQLHIHQFGGDHHNACFHEGQVVGIGHNAHNCVCAEVAQLQAVVVSNLHSNVGVHDLAQGCGDLVEHCNHIDAADIDLLQHIAVLRHQSINLVQEGFHIDGRVIEHAGHIVRQQFAQPFGQIHIDRAGGVLQGQFAIEGNAGCDHGGIGHAVALHGGLCLHQFTHIEAAFRQILLLQGLIAHFHDGRCGDHGEGLHIDADGSGLAVRFFNIECGCLIHACGGGGFSSRAYLIGIQLQACIGQFQVLGLCALCQLGLHCLRCVIKQTQELAAFGVNNLHIHGLIDHFEGTCDGCCIVFAIIFAARGEGNLGVSLVQCQICGIGGQEYLGIIAAEEHSLHQRGVLDLRQAGLGCAVAHVLQHFLGKHAAGLLEVEGQFLGVTRHQQIAHIHSRIIVAAAGQRAVQVSASIGGQILGDFNAYAILVDALHCFQHFIQYGISIRQQFHQLGNSAYRHPFGHNNLHGSLCICILGIDVIQVHEDLDQALVQAGDLLFIFDEIAFTQSFF